MQFTSYAFVGFLALVLTAYYLVPARCQRPLLLAASYGFYGAASPWYLLFILTTTASAYAVSLRLAALAGEQRAYFAAHGDLTAGERAAYEAGIKKRKWAWLVACLVLNIGVLSVTKYTNFVLRSVHGLLGGQWRPVDMIVPMGISFYTFQTVSYVVDVYRGRQRAERNFFKLALFVSFFPQLVQGPISRYGQLSETLFAPHRFAEKTFSQGMMRVLWGYFKKVVLADRIAIAVDAVYAAPERYGGWYLIAATVFYAFELYCDFTGGIDIAVGVGEAMGIRLPENFDLPYFSRSVKQFWKRWHITMGTWFRDYLYIPLGGNRKGRARTYCNTMAVFLVSGLWHGAGWNFVAWGGLNGLYQVIGEASKPARDALVKKLGLRRESGWYRAAQVFMTFVMIDFAWIFFRAPDMGTALRIVRSICTVFDPVSPAEGSLLTVGLTGADWLVLAAGFAAVLGASLYKSGKGSVRQALYEKPAGVFYGVMALLLVCTVVFGAYGAGYDASQFIYNRF